MNEQISWDPSLVKKFGSLNHFKLLNQLRSEVKKYPLNKNKTTSLNLSKVNQKEPKTILSKPNCNDTTLTNNTNINIDSINNKSTVSFNNSKNFSIYNNVDNLSTNVEKESQLNNSDDFIDNSSISTFKDRLNKIDMK